MWSHTQTHPWPSTWTAAMRGWPLRHIVGAMTETPDIEPRSDSVQAPIENASKPTEEWVTGDEPITGPQHSYLQTLAREAGRELPDQLTKAQASDLIEELQSVTGRGQN
jgi:Protein of unknown function (DUF3072)